MADVAHPGGESTKLGIGAFARLSGLSIPRLRRYHEAGLLVPSEVDGWTAYRTCRRGQVAKARELSRLRRADVPVQELADAMSSDPSVRLGVLLVHRRRLGARLAADQQMIELLDQLIREERVNSTTESLQPMEVIIRVADVEQSIAFYRDVFGFDFQPSDHEDAPLHYNASGGSWDPEGFFLFTIFPASGWTTKAEFGFGVDNVDDVWMRAKRYDCGQVEPPRDSNHIPRYVTIADPAGNRVILYQRINAR